MEDFGSVSFLWAFPVKEKDAYFALAKTKILGILICVSHGFCRNYTEVNDVRRKN
jgi:hypothetical protein